MRVTTPADPSARLTRAAVHGQQCRDFVALLTVRGWTSQGMIARVRNPPEDHYLAVWIWPRALPLREIFGTPWDDPEIRARFLTLASQWHTRHPSPAPGPDGDRGPQPGQWMWHPPAHSIYDSHTYEEPGDDWLEVAIRMENADYHPGHCRVEATLAVACRCESGHGQHTIVETRWRSGSPVAALDALTTVLRATDQWLAGSRRPSWWRRHAGLG